MLPVRELLLHPGASRWEGQAQLGGLRPPLEGAVPISDGEMAVAVPLAPGTARAPGGIGGSGGAAVVSSPPPQGRYWSLDRSCYVGWWNCLVGLHNHQLST